MKWKIVIVYFLLVTGYSHAQDTRSTNIYDTKASFTKPYFKSYLTDTKNIIISPFHWKDKQWLLAGSVVTATAFLLTQDKTIRNSFSKNQTGSLDNISKYGFEPWGNKYAFALTGSFYIEGLINKNGRSKKVAMEGAKAMLITSLFTQLTKYGFQRHRPYQDIPADPFKADGPFRGFSTHKSFFSGHTSTVFSLAAIFSLEYKEQKWVPYLAYSIAAGTAISRIYEDDHWASDVFAGAAAGYFIARLIHRENNWGIVIQPFSSRKEKGIQLCYTLK